MKKNKKSVVETLKNTFKKQSKLEKEKRYVKKKIKKNKPRGYGARKFGAIIFWVLFSFMFFIVFINMFGGSSSDSANQQELIQSKVASHEAVEYSKSFIFDLFNTLEDKEERKDKLEKYVPSDLNVDDALSFDNNLAVDLKKEDITLYDFSETSEEKARFVFGVKLKTKTKLTENEQNMLEEVKEDPKAKEDFYEDLLAEDETITSVRNNEKIRDVELFVVIPLSYNGNSFVVYDYPSYTYLDLDEDKSTESLIAMLDNVSDSEVEENVGAFLDTFFKSFAQDSTDQLQYILNDESYKNGLNNSLAFDRVQDFTLYKGQDEEMVVDTDVVFSHESTGFNVTSNYILVIAKKEQRYVVNHINNDQYIYDLIFGEQEEDEAENDDVESNLVEDNDDEEQQKDIKSSSPEVSLEQLKKIAADRNTSEFKNSLYLEDESPFSDSFELMTGVISMALDEPFKLSDEIDLSLIPKETLSDMGVGTDDSDVVDSIKTVEDLILYGALEQINEMFESESDISKYVLEESEDDNKATLLFEGEKLDGDNKVVFENSFVFIKDDSKWQLYHYESTSVTHNKDVDIIEEKEKDKKPDKKPEEKPKNDKKDKEDEENSKA